MSAPAEGGIYAALAAVMADCKAVAKRDANTEQRYYFRGIDAVVNAVGPILRDHRVTVMPMLVHVDYGERVSKAGALGTICRVVVDYVFTAIDGSSITTRVAAEAMDYSDKATAKAMSVAFRTALLQALALPTDDKDPDAETPEAAAPEQPRSTQRVSRGGKVTQAQLTKIAAGMSELGYADRSRALEVVGKIIGRQITTRNDLTKAEAHTVIEAIEAKLAEVRVTTGLDAAPVDEPDGPAFPDGPPPVEGPDPWAQS